MGWVLGLLPVALLVAGFPFFLVLLAIPVWRERSPLWRANQAAMKLARELAIAKKDAAMSGQAVRISLEPTRPGEGLRLRKERLASCASKPVSSETVPLRGAESGLEWLPEERALEWSVPAVISTGARRIACPYRVSPPRAVTVISSLSPRKSRARGKRSIRTFISSALAAASCRSARLSRAYPAAPPPPYPVGP